MALNYQHPLLSWGKGTLPLAYPYDENLLWARQELLLRFDVTAINQGSDQEILTHGLAAPLALLPKHSRKATFELDSTAYQPLFHCCIEQLGDE